MEQKIIISCDSTADLSPELLERFDIRMVPLSIVKDDQTLKDGIDINQHDIFAYKEQTGNLLKTCAPNLAECENTLKGYKEEFGDDCAIIHFDISSEMSSTYANYVNAAEDFSDVYIVDSRNLSTGIGLLVLRAAELRDKGLAAKDIFDEITALRDKVDATFVIDTLEYLHKGGRCSTVAMLGANLLKLKPEIEVRDGKMSVAKKYRGKIGDCFLNYVRDMLSDADSIETDRVFVTHTVDEDKMDMVDNVVKLVKELVPFKEVLVTRAGCSISVHCGPNTLGILFIRKSKV
ncbi:MAG: DegV family protein [Acutalibacteraceae bacterium]